MLSWVLDLCGPLAKAQKKIINASKTVIKERKALTPDMDGKSSTAELGEAILDKL